MMKDPSCGRWGETKETPKWEIAEEKDRELFWRLTALNS
jgi:hypothetical protein